jgi:hypothetical protein
MNMQVAKQGGSMLAGVGEYPVLWWFSGIYNVFPEVVKQNKYWVNY